MQKMETTANANPAKAKLWKNHQTTRARIVAGRKNIAAFRRMIAMAPTIRKITSRSRSTMNGSGVVTSATLMARTRPSTVVIKAKRVLGKSFHLPGPLHVLK